MLTASLKPKPKATAAEVESEKWNLTAMAAKAKGLYDKYDDVLLTDK